MTNLLVKSKAGTSRNFHQEVFWLKLLHPLPRSNKETFKHIEIEPSGSVDIVWLNVPSLFPGVPRRFWGIVTIAIL